MQALLMVTFLCLSGHTIVQVEDAKLKMNVLFAEQNSFLTQAKQIILK